MLYSVSGTQTPSFVQAFVYFQQYTIQLMLLSPTNMWPLKIKINLRKSSLSEQLSPVKNHNNSCELINMFNFISSFFVYVNNWISSFFATAPRESVMRTIDPREKIFSPRPKRRLWDTPAPTQILPLLPPCQSPSSSSSSDLPFETDGYYWKREKNKTIRGV